MSFFRLAVLLVCARSLRTEQGIENPPGKLGKLAFKGVQGMARNNPLKPGQGFSKFSKGVKGFQFRMPSNAFSTPGHAFKPLRSQLGPGFGRFGGQMGRMPQPTLGRMPGIAKRFSSTNAQVVGKSLDILSFQNFPPGLKDRILFNVEQAIQTQPTRQKMCHSIRQAFWHMFSYPNNDVFVLISKTEMHLAKAAEEGVARFRIPHGGQDLFVTILKRSSRPSSLKEFINYGYGNSDLELLNSFGRGIYNLQNIFQRKSLDFIYMRMKEVLGKSGLSDVQMARQMEGFMQQKWGSGWNVLISRTHITTGLNQNDIKAAFKVGERFITFLRQC